MRIDEYEAVVVPELGTAYCTQCAPEGYEVLPIFAGNEWPFPGVVCDKCGGLHDYMSLIAPDDDEVMGKFLNWLSTHGACDEVMQDSDEWVEEGVTLKQLWQSPDPEMLFNKVWFLVRSTVCQWEVQSVLYDTVVDILKEYEVSRRPESLEEWYDLSEHLRQLYRTDGEMERLRDIVESYICVIILTDKLSSANTSSMLLNGVDVLQGEDALRKLDKELQELVRWDDLFEGTLNLIYGKE